MTACDHESKGMPVKSYHERETERLSDECVRLQKELKKIRQQIGKELLEKKTTYFSPNGGDSVDWLKCDFVREICQMEDEND